MMSVPDFKLENLVKTLHLNNTKVARLWFEAFADHQGEVRVKRAEERADIYGGTSWHSKLARSSVHKHDFSIKFADSEIAYTGLVCLCFLFTSWAVGWAGVRGEEGKGLQPPPRRDRS